MDRVEGYPLFLLNIVLLPSETTMLHVFEERYRELASRCIDGKEEFGLVFVDGDGRPSEFGCATRITDIVRRYDDGRLDIAVRGVEPIRLIEMEDQFPYPSAVVEHVPEIPAGSEDPAQRDRTRDAFKDLLIALGAKLPDDDALEIMNAYAMAAMLAMDDSHKQALLELRDENERLETLEGLFTGAIGKVKTTRKIAQQAQTNGHRKLPPKN